MHRTHGSFQLYNVTSCRPSSWSCPVLLFEMHSAKASRSNFLTAHPLGLSRGGFWLCNSNQTYRWSPSDSSSNIFHSHRYLLRVGRRKVKSRTDNDALLSYVAIPGSLITIRSSVYLALKSPATMIGPGHCLTLGNVFVAVYAEPASRERNMIPDPGATR